MSLFLVKIKFRWFAPVYIPLPPDEVCCLVYVCTSTYLYVPLCTGMYYELTKLEQFWNSTSSHCIPCIGAVQPLSYLSWLFLDESKNNLNLSSWKYVLVCTGTYQYVRTWNSRTALYRVVLVRTGTYQYVPICPILSRSVSRYSCYYSLRIPDGKSFSVV